MTEQNQYQTPTSNVEQAGVSDYGRVTLFSVSGRIGRIRYLAYSFGLGIVFGLLIMGAMSLVFEFGMSAGDGGTVSALGLVTMLIVLTAYIVLFVFIFMLTIQRAHDFNVSGWLSLIIFIPLGSLLFIFIPGTDGENQYGLKTPPNGSATIVVIVLALLIPTMGIVAAISIPAYQAYVEKAAQMKLEQTN